MRFKNIANSILAQALDGRAVPGFQIPTIDEDVDDLDIRLKMEHVFEECIRDWTYVVAGFEGPLTHLKIPCRSYQKAGHTLIESFDPSKPGRKSTAPELKMYPPDDIRKESCEASNPKRRRMIDPTLLTCRAQDLFFYDLNHFLEHGDAATEFFPSTNITSPSSVTGYCNAAPNFVQPTDVGSLSTTVEARINTKHHPSRVPLSSNQKGPSVVFLSQLIPRSLTDLKRFQVLEILRFKARYLPSCVVSEHPHPLTHRYYGTLNDNLERLPTFYDLSPSLSNKTSTAMRPTFTSPLSPSGHGWPPDTIPVDIYAQIANHLSSDDIKTMRLVNRETEEKISRYLFSSVVVPFRSEIYGMIVRDSNLDARKDVRGKGKGRINRPRATSSTIRDASFGLYSGVGKADDIAAGMKVFEGWGPHIRRFAMSFEIDEDVLANPPTKVKVQHVQTWWGAYSWPLDHYSRFSQCERLEKTADETHCMTAALSYLSNVNELGLSLDSGLGWLQGPDISDRAKIFKGKSKVFGTSHNVPSKRDEERMEAWNAVVNGACAPPKVDPQKVADRAWWKYVAVLKSKNLTSAEAGLLIAEYMEQTKIGSLSFSSMDSLENHIRTFMRRNEVVRLILDIKEGNEVTVWPCNTYQPTHRDLIVPLVLTVDESEYACLGRPTAADTRDSVDRRNTFEDRITFGSGHHRFNLADQLAPGVPSRRAMRDHIRDVNSHNFTTRNDNTASIGSLREAGTLRRNQQYSWQGLIHQYDTTWTGDCDELQQVLGFLCSCKDEDDAAPPLIFQGLDIDNQYYKIRETACNSCQFVDYPLNPRTLSSNQKEWLIETEWAQRAFLSSYVLAVIDNSNAFQNVNTFTLAKVSSGHLISLDRQDFWSALPNLKTLTVLVSPDWRQVTKGSNGEVDTCRILPSSASAQLFRLLQKNISNLRSLKTLTIGYVGGGEHAKGLHGRNRNVLPAPIYNNMRDYDSDNTACNLNLPYVKNLTITNCWFSSGSLKSLVSEMKTKTLEILRLDSVSLIAYGGSEVPQQVPFAGATFRPNPPFNGPWAIPQPATYLQMDGATRRFQTARQFLFPQQTTGGIVSFGHHGQLPRNTRPRRVMGMPGFSTGSPEYDDDTHSQSSGDGDDSSWLMEDFDVGSWEDVINCITPGCDMSQLRHMHGIGEEPEQRSSGSLLRLEFESCGYVKLHTQSSVNEEVLQMLNLPTHEVLRKRYSELEKYMMSSSTRKDPYLGQIVPGVSRKQKSILRNAFRMRWGWGDDPKKYESLEDGQPLGGCGRFSGTIKKFSVEDRFWETWAPVSKTNDLSGAPGPSAVTGRLSPEIGEPSSSRGKRADSLDLEDLLAGPTRAMRFLHRNQPVEPFDDLCSMEDSSPTTGPSCTSDEDD